MNAVLKKSALVLLLGAALSAQATVQATVQVGVDAQQPWQGFMNWWDLPADGGALSGQSFWAPADLSAQFSGSTLTLTPNTSTDRDAPLDPVWWNDGASNKLMGANLFVVDDSLAGLNIVFAGSVLSNTLAGGYTSRAFIRAFDANFTQVLAGAEVDLLDGQPFQVTFQSTPDHAHIEYGFDTIGPNARVGSSLGSVVIATVPEPSAWAMMAAGLLGVAALRRRGQRS